MPVTYVPDDSANGRNEVEIQPGAPAPGFELPAYPGGQKASLREYVHLGPVVVAFYPKDNTSG